MSVSVVEEATGTLTCDGTEQTLFTEEDIGVFFVRLDTNDMTAAESIEVREYISAQAASTQRQLGKTMCFVAPLQEKIIELPHRSIPANASYAVTIKSVGATHPDIVWAELEVGS